MTGRKTVRITEAQLARMVSAALNEKFSKDSLKQAVKAGGGLASNFGTDARDNRVDSSLADSDAVGRLSKETVRALEDAGVMFFIPLDQQLVKCQDGSAIVLDSKLDTNYTDKLNRRQANWYTDRGFGDHADKWARKDDRDGLRHGLRRYERRQQRGVKKQRGQKPGQKQD